MGIVTIFGINFDYVDPIISIGSISFDLRKAIENYPTTEGELARLYLNILGWKETHVGPNHTIPARIGIDISTASYDEISDYLNTTTEKMSESIRELLRKCMRIKNVTKFKKEINLVSQKLKNEYSLIHKEKQNIDSLGVCGGGVLGDVRLDKS